MNFTYRSATAACAAGVVLVTSGPVAGADSPPVHGNVMWLDRLATS